MKGINAVRAAVEAWLAAAEKERLAVKAEVEGMNFPTPPKGAKEKAMLRWEHLDGRIEALREVLAIID